MGSGEYPQCLCMPRIPQVLSAWPLQQLPPCENMHPTAFTHTFLFLYIYMEPGVVRLDNKNYLRLEGIFMEQNIKNIFFLKPPKNNMGLSKG